MFLVKKSLKTLAGLALATSLASFVLPAAAAVNAVQFAVATDGTPGWDPTAGPGFDTGATNGIVRTNDAFEYLVTFSTSGGDNNVTFVITLPKGDVAPRSGQAVARWSYLPQQCTGTGSNISADGQTLTCNVGTVASVGTRSFYANATVLATTPNATTIAPPTIVTTSDAGTASAPTQMPIPLKVAAAPYYDMVIQTSHQGSPRAYGLNVAGGPNNEAGFYHRLLTGIVAFNPNGNGIKGVEMLSGSAFNYELNVNGYPTGVLLDNWHNGSSPAGTPAAGTSMQDGCSSAANSSIHNPSAESGGTVNLYDKVLDAGPTTSGANTVVVNGGDCTVYDSTTPVLGFTITGMDGSFTRRPTNQSSTNTPIPLSEWWLANKAIVLWTPLSSYPANSTTSHAVSYVPGSWTATSISGQPVIEARASNNTASYQIERLSSGSAAKIYTAGDTGIPDNARAQCDPAVTADCYANYIAHGQVYNATVRLSNTGTEPLNQAMVCEIIDRTAYDLGPNFQAVMSSGSATIQYGTKTGSRFFTSTDSSNARQNASIASDTSEYQTATCDNPTITWYATAAEAEAAGGLVFVRAISNAPIIGNGTMYLVVRNLQLRATWAATINVLGPQAGVRVAGQPILPGTLIRNAGDVGMTGLGVDNTKLRDDIEVVEMKTTSRVTKSLVSPVTSSTSPVEVGSVITYELQPRFSTTFVPYSRQFTVTDILPPGLNYVAGSATVGGVAQAPVVTANFPDAGYTRLVWTFNYVPTVGRDGAAANTPAIRFSARASNTLVDGSVLSNAVAVSAPSDYVAECVYSTQTKTYGACQKSASVNVTIQTPPGFRVSKTTSTPTIQPGDAFQYRVDYASLGESLPGAEIPDFIDILPFVGDGVSNPTNSFNGRNPATATAVTDTSVYRLVSVVPPSQDPSMVVYYTNRRPSQIHHDASHPTNALGTGTTRWCLASELGTAGCPATLAEVSAVRASPRLPSLSANTIYSITLNMQSITDKVVGGDLFHNSIGARSPSASGSLLFVEAQSDQPVQVTSSALSGQVFVDANQNNILDGTDAGIPDVCVAVTGTTTGNVAVQYSMKTNADGNYAFAARALNAVYPSADCSGTAMPVFAGLVSGKYSVREVVQPTDYVDGADYTGTADGTVANDLISDINLAISTVATGYNFTELEVSKITVAKALTNGNGVATGVAEAGETLDYTVTATNSGGSPSGAVSFYEVLPEHTTFVSLTPASASTDCVRDVAGPRLCKITLAGPIPANNGQATALFTVKVINPLPANATVIRNLVTDNADTPPAGCDPATSVCTPPPACTDPTHCVETPIARPPVAVDDSKLDNPVGTAVTLPVTGNDSDPDNNLDASTVSFDPISVPAGAGTDTDGDGDIDQVVVPGQGTWTVDSSGNATFTPESGYTGNPTPIQYTVKDTTGLVSNEATITVDYDQKPSYNMVKTNDTPTITSPGVITYTFTFTNNGDVPVYNLTVADSTIDAGSLTGCPIAGPLAPGAVASCTAKRTVTLAMIATKADIVNTAVPSATSTPDPNGPPAAEDNDGDPSTPDDPSDNTTTTKVVINPPVAVDDTKTGNTVGTAATLPITGNDSDLDNDLDPSTVSFDPTSVPSGAGTDTDGDGDIDQVVVPGQGTWTVDSSGNATFTPESGYTGNPTPIQYTVKDTTGLVSNEATITVDYDQKPSYNMVKTNDTPTISAPGVIMYTFTFTNNGNVPVYNLNVADRDIDTGSLTGCPIAGPLAPGAVASCTAKRTVTTDMLAANQPIVNTAVPSATTTSDENSPPVAEDNDGDPNTPDDPSDNTTTTRPVLDPPVAVDDSAKGTVGQPVTLPITANDSDPNNNLDVGTVNFVPGSVPGGVGTDTDGDGDIDRVVVPGEGTWTVDNNGGVTFTPEAGFTGDPTPIKYTVRDTTNLISNEAVITIDYDQKPSYNMVKTNDKPTISEPGVITYTFTFTNNGNVPVYNLTVADSTIDAGSLTGCPITGPLAPGAVATCKATRTVTVAMLAANQPIVNTAVPSATSTSDVNSPPVAEDHDGDPTTPNDMSDNTTSSRPVLDPPVAVDDKATGTVGQPMTLVVTGNDSDPNNNLDVETVNFVPGSVPGGVGADTDGDGDIDRVVVPGQGTWTVDNTGRVTFTPETGFSGDPTPIKYTVNDTTGLVSNEALITIDYLQRPPVAVDDNKNATDIGQPVTQLAITNDSDPDGDLAVNTINLDATSVPGGVGTDTDGDGDIDRVVVPGQGTWTVDNEGNATFTPESGFFTDPTPIAYTVKDRSGLVSNVAHISVNYPERAVDLMLEKTSSVKQAEVGDLVNYSIVVRNVGAVSVPTPTIVDRLPAGFQITDASVRVTGATLVSVDGAPGPIVRVTVDRILPGQAVTITYAARIGVGAQQGDGINRAKAECLTPNGTGRTECSNEGQWKVEVRGGVFADEGCIVGQIFVDCNYNSMKDREELGISGVRMYLEDGTYLVSDVEGKYSYCGVRPTTHVLKVDQTTLPTRSRLVTSSNRNVGDANSIFVDLKNGEMQRADFIEGSCNNEVIEQVKARRAQGEVSSVQTEAKQPALKFESKPVPQGNPLQQGTDSANQDIERQRGGGQP